MLLQVTRLPLYSHILSGKDCFENFIKNLNNEISAFHGRQLSLEKQTNDIVSEMKTHRLSLADQQRRILLDIGQSNDSYDPHADTLTISEDLQMHTHIA